MAENCGFKGIACGGMYVGVNLQKRKIHKRNIDINLSVITLRTHLFNDNAFIRF